MFIVLTKFAICSAAIIITGIKAARYGDIIAEKTILGRALVGLFLLALITSLPELFCGISSVAIVGIPDLTMGDIFGSCIYNLAILGMLDILNKKEPFLYRAGRGHITIASYFMILMGFVLVSIIASRQPAMRLNIGWIGIYTLIIPLLYFWMAKRIFQIEQSKRSPLKQEQYGDVSLKSTLWKFAAASAVVIVAATWLPKIGEEIAKRSGMAETFVGTLFLAATTSFPELVVTITAWKIGSRDMAIANVLGSNLFDLLIIAIDDVFYLKGPILSDINPAHMLTGITAMIMSGVIIAGIVCNSDRKTFRVINWDGLALIALFLTGVMGLWVLL